MDFKLGSAPHPESQRQILSESGMVANNWIEVGASPSILPTWVKKQGIHPSKQKSRPMILSVIGIV
ncbi:MAG: hypothetical protein EXR17_03430 [Flavobacteriaceae bacterium]|nr:hypothetical protein [Flavobacteriaceae bacterium]